MRKKLATLGAAGFILMLSTSPAMAAESVPTAPVSFYDQGERDAAFEKISVQQSVIMDKGVYQTDLLASAVTMGEQNVWAAPTFSLSDSSVDPGKGLWSLDGNVASFAPSETCFGVSRIVYPTNVVTIPQTSESEGGGSVSSQFSGVLPDVTVIARQPLSCELPGAVAPDRDAELAKFEIVESVQLDAGELQTNLTKSAVSMTGTQTAWDNPTFTLKSVADASKGKWVVENNVAAFKPVEECYGTSTALFGTVVKAKPVVDLNGNVSFQGPDAVLSDVSVTATESLSCSMIEAPKPVVVAPVVAKPTLVSPPKQNETTPVKPAAPVAEKVEASKPAVKENNKKTPVSAERVPVNKIHLESTESSETNGSRTSDSKGVKSDDRVVGTKTTTNPGKQAEKVAVGTPEASASVEEAGEPISMGGGNLLMAFMPILTVLGGMFVTVIASLGGGHFVALRELRKTK